MKNNIVIRTVLIILILIDYLCIYSFSAQNGEESSSRSDVIVNAIVKTVNIDEEKNVELIDNITFGVRKTAHVSIYAITGFLLVSFMNTYEIKKIYQCGIAQFGGILYAISDEVHQLYVPERSGQVTDVLIDSLGILIGILIGVLIFYIKKHSKENNKKTKKVFFISSTGGHLSELLQLKNLFDEYEYRLITEKDKTNEDLKEKYNGKVSYLVYGTKKNLFKYIFIFTFNILKSLILLIRYNPDVIVTTGTHTAVPMCYLGKLFCKKVIFIETFANINTKTVAGRIVYPIADVFVVQWKEMLELYPKAKYWGWIY